MSELTKKPCISCGRTGDEGGRWLDPTMCGPCYNSRPVSAPKLDGELVERIAKEVAAEFYAGGDDWADLITAAKKQATICAERVLHVAADALLGPVTDEERKQYRELHGFFPPAVDIFLSGRLERLTAKPKTLKEQIEDKVHLLVQMQAGSPESYVLADEVLALVRMKREQVQP